MRTRSGASPLPAMPIASKSPIRPFCRSCSGGETDSGAHDATCWSRSRGDSDRRAQDAVAGAEHLCESLVVEPVFGELRRFLIDTDAGAVRAVLFGLYFGLKLNLVKRFAAVHRALQLGLEVDFLAFVAGSIGVGDVARQGSLALPGAAHRGLEQLLGRLDGSHIPSLVIGRSAWVFRASSKVSHAAGRSWPVNAESCSSFSKIFPTPPYLEA